MSVAHNLRTLLAKAEYTNKKKAELEAAETRVLQLNCTMELHDEVQNLLAGNAFKDAAKQGKKEVVIPTSKLLYSRCMKHERAILTDYANTCPKVDEISVQPHVVSEPKDGKFTVSVKGLKFSW